MRTFVSWFRGINQSSALHVACCMLHVACGSVARSLAPSAGPCMRHANWPTCEYLGVPLLFTLKLVARFSLAKTSDNCRRQPSGKCWTIGDQSWAFLIWFAAGFPTGFSHFAFRALFFLSGFLMAFAFFIVSDFSCFSLGFRNALRTKEFVKLCPVPLPSLALSLSLCLTWVWLSYEPGCGELLTGTLGGCFCVGFVFKTLCKTRNPNGLY